jgi:tetrahydromethanopterin S-methyltransferase subunit G
MNERGPDPDFPAWDADLTEQYRIIGRLEAQVASTEERLDRIETKLDVITEHIQRQKGGRNLLWGIATAGGVIGILLSKVLGAIVDAFRGSAT